MSSSDVLPADIERLMDDGSNWFIYEMRFSLAMRAKGKWGHFNGMLTRPANAPAAPNVAGMPQAEADAALAAHAELELEAIEQQLMWDRNENMSEYMLAQRISNSLLGRLRRHITVAEKWAAMTTEFMQKTMYQTTTMKADFLARRCAQDGDVRVFLDSLETERETLAMSGVDITDTEYRSTMVSGIPSFLREFATTQIESARTFASQVARIPGLTINTNQVAALREMIPETLRTMIIGEAERRKCDQEDRAREKSKKATALKPAKDEALYVEQDKKTKKKSGKRPARECWNCGEKGHFRDKCPKPKKEKGKGKSNDSANAVADDDDDEDDVWDCAHAVFESEAKDDGLVFIGFEGERDDREEADSRRWQSTTPEFLSEVCHGITIDSCSEDEDLPAGELLGPDTMGIDVSLEWFETGSDSDETEHGAFCNGDELVVADSDEELVSSEDEELVATVTHLSKTVDGARRTILDSGCTRHITPYKEDMSSFHSIPPRGLKAANQRTFDATGEGDILVEIPNGPRATKIRLTKVLYSPEVGYTLISVGALDRAGYKSIFGNGKCTMHNRGDAQVAEIACTANGLYRQWYQQFK